MQNRLKDAGVITWTNGTGSDVSSGDVVDLTDRVGVAGVDIANGESGSVQTCGIFNLPKDTSDIAQGEDVVWDISASKVTTGTPAVGDFEDMGKAVAAAGTSATYVEVEINVPKTMTVTT